MQMRVVMLPILLSPLAPWVVMATCGAIKDDRVDIKRTLVYSVSSCSDSYDCYPYSSGLFH